MNARLAAAILSVCAIGLAACDDGPTGTDAGDATLNYDVAMVSADATIEDVRALRDPASGGYFMEGRSGTRSVSFYDAEDNEQDAYDELTTAKVVMIMEMERELERSGWTAYMTRSREMTITGLEGVETTRTVNGFGSEEVTRSRHTDADGLRTYEMSGTRTIEDVVHPVPQDATSWPLSGTITRNMTITITTENGTETRSREVIIIFNGTQYPEMTVNGEAFEIDLAARDGEMPFRHRHRDRIGQ
jgi:hypothetical protein